MSQPNVNVICTSSQNNNSFTCLDSRPAIVGITMNIAASLLSLGSLLYIFGFIVYAHRHTFKAGIHIFYNDMDLIIFSLLCAEFVQAVGVFLNLKWILDGVVKVGPFCDAQGILMVAGETAVALSTLLVGTYTFFVISTGRTFKSMRTTVAIVVGIWALVAIPVGVGHGITHNPTKSRFISPTPFWCWVSRDYLAWRIAIQYLWLWITLFILPLLYIPLYLWMRGNLVFRDSVWYRWSLQSRKFSDPNLRPSHRTWVMLLYPAVYYGCILPISLVRWIAFLKETQSQSGRSDIPLAAIFTATTIFNLSGFFNVILISTTKPNLGLFGQRDLGRPPLPVNQSRQPEPVTY